MATQYPPESTVDEVLYKGWRDLRDLGNQSPGFTLEKAASRELGILQEDGIPDGHQVQLTIFEDGTAVADLQVE